MDQQKMIKLGSLQNNSHHPWQHNTTLNNIYVDYISSRHQATTPRVSSPATMETNLLQSTSLKSGTKGNHHV